MNLKVSSGGVLRRMQFTSASTAMDATLTCTCDASARNAALKNASLLA